MTSQLEQCPAAIELPGLRAPCPCADFAAKFGTPPPADHCPARETVDEMRRQHGDDMAAVRSATAASLHELSRAIRAANSSVAALEALARRSP